MKSHEKSQGFPNGPRPRCGPRPDIALRAVAISAFRRGAPPLREVRYGTKEGSSQKWLVNMSWLVVWTPLNNRKVSWDDDIPNVWKNKNVPNHQPSVNVSLDRRLTNRFGCNSATCDSPMWTCSVSFSVVKYIQALNWNPELHRIACLSVNTLAILPVLMGTWRMHIETCLRLKPALHETLQLPIII